MQTVYLMASNDQNIQVIFDHIRGCITFYYSMKVSEKSERVGINGAKKRRWKFRLSSMGNRIMDANGVLGMVNYAAARSGSKYVVGR